mmetsp:Transcript_35321/g.111044  ORF Transcript_35321/g.111044 Transcript_35321/m.111044 type:complete len:82 (-) Transcript_35321:296-541(-)|eukprot:CAMPEP_0185524710 /NCGR_PEP_ID=MMETSP1366-20130426/88878_1 /TAXON_ID=38817 /ORGANISM="Gephyrocapsa oceanica, Strain RCC1303" /LENGTH=81 /DNA_ID=CAMNT_0028136075 /DNA_START=54 /DNA_END=299 /DNA_ORIENTATION=-
MVTVGTSLDERRDGHDCRSHPDERQLVVAVLRVVLECWCSPLALAARDQALLLAERRTRAIALHDSQEARTPQCIKRQAAV